MSMCNYFRITALVFLTVCVNNAFAACDCGSADPSNPCEGTGVSISLSKDDKTLNFNWSFNSSGEPAYCGQFANGDYWVAPQPGKSVSLTGITTNGGRGISAGINPLTEKHGFLDGTVGYNSRDPAENIIPKLPVTLTDPANRVPTRSFSSTNIDYAVSVVAAVQRKEPDDGICGTKAIEGECVEAYNILTVLSEPPLKNGSTLLRPNMTGATKDIVYMEELDLTLIPEYSFFDSHDADSAENARERWSHHSEVFSVVLEDGTADGRVYSEGGRAYRAHIFVTSYAAGVAQIWYKDMTALMSGKMPSGDEKKLLAAMLSYGLDLYKAVYDDSGDHYRYFGSGAGQYLGKFIAPVFLGALMRDDTYRNALRRESEEVVGSGLAPNELEQVKVGPTGREVWGDGPAGQLNAYDIKRYWTELFDGKCYDGASGSCNPNVGKKTTRDPYGYIDGPPAKPGSTYASVVLGPQRSMAAMMFAMPEICEIINNDHFVNYVLRVDRHGIWTADDPCAPPDPRESSSCDVWDNGTGCNYYRVTWGPTKQDDQQCVSNAAGQNGRYGSIDGSPIDPGYKTTQIEENWSRLVGDKNSCRVNRPVPPGAVRVSLTAGGPSVGRASQNVTPTPTPTPTPSAKATPTPTPTPAPTSLPDTSSKPVSTAPGSNALFIADFEWSSIDQGPTFGNITHWWPRPNAELSTKTFSGWPTSGKKSLYLTDGAWAQIQVFNDTNTAHLASPQEGAVSMEIYRPCTLTGPGEMYFQIDGKTKDSGSPLDNNEGISLKGRLTGGDDNGLQVGFGASSTSGYVTKRFASSGLDMQPSQRYSIAIQWSKTRSIPGGYSVQLLVNGKAYVQSSEDIPTFSSTAWHHISLGNDTDTGFNLYIDDFKVYPNWQVD